jgi:hypothetical protein
MMSQHLPLPWWQFGAHENMTCQKEPANIWNVLATAQKATGFRWIRELSKISSYSCFFLVVALIFLAISRLPAFMIREMRSVVGMTEGDDD